MQSAQWEGEWPLTQGYGATDFASEPYGHGVDHWHEGIDVGMPNNTRLYAASNSVVVVAVAGAVVLEDDEGIRHYYFHCMSAEVPQGARVARRQLVALSGNRAVPGGVPPTGPHLHYGVRVRGDNPNNPYGYQVDDISPWRYIDMQRGEKEAWVESFYQLWLDRPVENQATMDGWTQGIADDGSNLQAIAVQIMYSSEAIQHHQNLADRNAALDALITGGKGVPSVPDHKHVPGGVLQ